MKHFAVIGNPVDHSLSPELHNWVFNHLNIQAKYEKIRVYKNFLQETVQCVRKGELRGINVTIPHKESIIEFLDEVNPRAKAIGAVNCIVKAGSKLVGNNTDWYGFSHALNFNKIEIAKKDVIILGAGGAAKSILFALKQMGVNKILLFNRTIEKAEPLQDDQVQISPFDDIVKIITNKSIIINTTSVGMQSSQAPINLGLLHKNQVIIDIIYNPLETAIIKFGKKIGAKTMNGLDMFIFQGLASLDLWFGDDISKQVKFQELKEHLTRILS